MIFYTLSLGLSTALASTPIQKVVVYSDRAEVTRTGSATCSKGSAEVLFENLPRILDRRTLRGEAKGKATVIGVDSKLNILTKQLNKNVEISLFFSLHS